MFDFKSFPCIILSTITTQIYNIKFILGIIKIHIYIELCIIKMYISCHDYIGTKMHSKIWGLPQDIYKQILPDRDRMSLFARTNKEMYKLHHGRINEYFPPTEDTLHQAIQKGASYDTVMSLIRFFPELPFPDAYGSLLHCAVSSKSPIDVIEYLIQNNVGFSFDDNDDNLREQIQVQTATIYDQNGNLPLHIAISNARDTPQYSLRVISALLSAFPHSIFFDKKDNMTPLSDVMGNATAVWDNYGMCYHDMTPLHLAIDKFAGLEVIQALIANNKHVLMQTSYHPDYSGDVDGDVGRVLPVHLAADKQTPLNVVRLLIEMFPKSITMEDPYWRRAPLHWALVGITRMQNTIDEDSINTIAYLLNKSPIVTTFVDENNMLPIEIAIQAYRICEEAHETPDSYILITLMRMYLNNKYPDAKHCVNWGADTAELKENIRHHESEKSHIYTIIESLLLEIEEHEELFKEDISKRTTHSCDSVIEKFENFVNTKKLCGGINASLAPCTFTLGPAWDYTCANCAY